MVLFIMLLAVLIVLTIAAVLTIGVFGAGGIIVFGDVFVCAAIIFWIMKRIFKKK